jgi:LSD1 subclass zinc finger protein
MGQPVRHVFTILATSLFFVVAICFCLDDASAQKQRRRTPPVSRPLNRVVTIDYSRFSHATSKHQAGCNTCHKVPTENWKKVRDFPDVADYPGHAACVGCHRPQFFRGAKPVVCSICHTSVSPRHDVRFAFRNPLEPRQFVIEFPHDKHQDVIAAMFLERRAQQRPRFLRASLTSSGIADDNGKHYNNCEICHLPRTTAPTAPPAGWSDGFIPEAAFFKSAPSSHAACFNCHWTTQQPTNANCGGCHKLADKAYVAVDTPQRFAMKFRHAREQHVAECTTCHINITKSGTLRGLKPDVPITACTECHNKDGLRLDVSKELESIDKNRDFVCSYCHTSEVGRRDPPSSHYLIAGREAIKRKDVK